MPDGDAYAPDRVLVQFEPGTAPSQQRSALSAAGVIGGAVVPGTDFVTVATEGQDPVEVVAQLEDDPRVAAVQLDHVRRMAGWPNDPEIYSLDPTIYNTYPWYYLEATRLPRAWDVATGTGIVVAVLDSGVDPSHPDLSGNVLPGWDFVNGDNNAADDNGHGTAVAGIVAAKANNGIGIAGAAPSSKVLPVKVLDAAGDGNDSVLAAGISYAVAQGADVLNISLGGSATGPVVLAAIQNAVASGAVVIAAAGNTGTGDAFYPAAYAPALDGLLAVSATDYWGGLTSFSTWGDWVSVAAPGWKIRTTARTTGYLSPSGTSMAAPFVSGVAALVMSNGTTSPAAVQAAILSGARDSGPRGVDPFFGRGVLDAAAALGLGTSIPYDRLPGDPTSEDGLPARARTLGATPAVATLSPEGDVDWYAFAAPEPGWYQVDVTVLDGWYDYLDEIKPVVEVRDGAGQLVGYNAAEDVNEAVRVMAHSTDGELLIGVTNANGTAGTSRYEVTASYYGRTLFDVANYNLGVSAVRSVVGDVTGDGVPDVVTAYSHSATLQVRAGGNGTFGAPVGVAIGATTSSNPGLVAFDADGDGDTDIAIGTTTGFQVLKQASGALSSFGGFNFEGAALGLGAADLNGDGKIDLVATRSTPTAMTTALPNDGTGTFSFSGAWTVTAAYVPAFAIGDVTKDGRPDVVAASGDVHIQQSSGSFMPAYLNIGGVDVAIGDLTHDGLADVVGVVSTYPEHVAVLAGESGVGNFFAPVATYPAGNTPRAIEIADIDGDGRRDVVVPNQSNQVGILYGQATGDLLTAREATWAIRTIASHDAAGLSVVDLDGDGYLDIVASGTGGFSVLRQATRDPLDGAAFVLDASTIPHDSGVGVRPTVALQLGRTLAAGAVNAESVRLIDGLSAVDVPAFRDYASGALYLTPQADLVPGRHYAVLVSGLVDVDSTVQDQSYWTWFTVAAAGARFTPVEPQRVLDTRFAVGASGPVKPGSPITLTLGGNIVPASATAVVLNVTAVAPSSVGNVRVYPAPSGSAPPPLVSNLNVVPGVDQPNLVTVSLGAGGAVKLATSGATAHLIADIAGYYSEGGATAYVPLEPVRVMDTRFGTGGVPATSVKAGGWVDLVVTGKNGVPVDASAVVLNVTGVGPSGRTNVRVYPSPAASESQAPPTVSNLNLLAGRDQPNLVTVRVGDGGKVRFYTQSAALHLVADLAGYYSPTGDNGFTPLAPVRIADTRFGNGLPQARLAPGVPSSLPVGGTFGVPQTATAAVLNVTAVNPASFTNVRVFPTPATPAVPLVSNLNVVQGRDEPNLVLVRLGNEGRVSFYSQSASLDLVVDLGGYFIRYYPASG